MVDDLDIMSSNAHTDIVMITTDHLCGLLTWDVRVRYQEITSGVFISVKGRQKWGSTCRTTARMSILSDFIIPFLLPCSTSKHKYSLSSDNVDTVYLNSDYNKLVD